MKHPIKYMGRRGYVIILLALLWFLVGTIVLITKRTIDPGNVILYEEFPIPVRVGMWWGSAGMAALGAFSLRCQNRAWLALCFMPVERLISHVVSFANYIIPGEPPGAGRGIVYVLIWVIILLLLGALAGWDEDTKRARPASNIKE